MHELKILLYGLPPNTTHLLQPLDVAVLKPLKTAWRTAVNDWQRNNPSSSLLLPDFAPMFIPLYCKAVKEQSVVNGFRACCLMPLDDGAPNYEKITTEAMLTDSAILFDGVDQGT